MPIKSGDVVHSISGAEGTVVMLSNGGQDALVRITNREQPPIVLRYPVNALAAKGEDLPHDGKPIH